MFIYKDRKLDIEGTLVSEYEAVKNRALSEKDIDNFLRIADMWKSARPEEDICTQTDEEISNTLSRILKAEIKYARQNNG